MTRTLPRPSPLAVHWALDPEVVYLNHGSFGGTPRAVLDAQHALAQRLEREPIRFFLEDLRPLLDDARAHLARFVGCAWDDLAPVPNATTGVATVFHNLADAGILKPGDEILTTTHEYLACQNNLRRCARRTGAEVVVADIPFPLASPAQVLDAVLSRVTPRTRIALLSHVTSSTGLVFPVQDLVPALHARNVETLIDAAHAPGMLPVDLAALRPTYYTANAHKWICSPKGSAFLYVDPNRRARSPFRPIILSNNAEKPIPGREQFLTEFDFVGTGDPTAFLSIPSAIRTIGSLLPGGWDAVRQHNHDLVSRGRDLLCRSLGVDPPAPDSMIGSIATVVLPPAPAPRPAPATPPQGRAAYYEPLQASLIERHSIQVPVWTLSPPIVPSPTRVLRISAQLHNSMEQYEYLADALKVELTRESAEN